MQYGLQLYSVRDSAAQNFQDTLKRVAQMGYSMVEPAGFFGHSAVDVAAWMREYGLTACSTHTGYQALKNDLAGQIAYHKAIGCKNIVIPGAPHSNANETAELVETINRIQPIIEDAGMTLHYHNHWQEFRPNADGQIVEEVLAEKTRIGFEIDTFWVYNAGVDVFEVLETYKDRIALIHLKDGIAQDFADPSSKPIGRSLGSGKAPVEKIRETAIANGWKIVVESEGLDPTGLEEVQRCIDFLKGLDAND